MDRYVYVDFQEAKERDLPGAHGDFPTNSRWALCERGGDGRIQRVIATDGARAPERYRFDADLNWILTELNDLDKKRMDAEQYGERIEREKDELEGKMRQALADAADMRKQLVKANIPVREAGGAGTLAYISALEELALMLDAPDVRVPKQVKSQLVKAMRLRRMREEG